MRRAVVAFVRGLPLDRRSRRVLDETLLDCEHEAVGATTVLMRFAVELRSLLSIARVLVYMALRDLPRVPAGWLLGRLVLFGVVPVAVLMSFSREVWPIQNLRLGTIVFTGWLPFALFCAIAWRPAARQLPILAVAACGAVLIATFVLYVSPHALWDFYRLQLREDQLFMVEPRWWAPVQALGPISLGAVLIVFAEAVRNLSGWRRSVLILATPCAYTALFSVLWLGAAFLTRQPYSVARLISSLMFFGVGIRPLRPFTLVCAASEIVLSLAVMWLSAHLTQRTSARA